MRWSMVVAAMALPIAGCVGPSPVYTPEFEPLPNNEFRYEAGADSLFKKADDPSAEADRMEALREILDHNHLCPKGYTITERKPVPLDQYLTRIFYHGVCTG